MKSQSTIVILLACCLTKTINAFAKCGTNQHFTQCISECSHNLRCESYLSGKFDMCVHDTPVCRPGCVCNHGYYRDWFDNCVKGNPGCLKYQDEYENMPDDVLDSSNYELDSSLCMEGEEWRTCATLDDCIDTCQYMDNLKNCSREKLNSCGDFGGACECKDGYVRDDDSYLCVRVEDCGKVVDDWSYDQFFTGNY